MCVDHLLHASHFKDNLPEPSWHFCEADTDFADKEAEAERGVAQRYTVSMCVCVLGRVGWNSNQSFSVSQVLVSLQLRDSSIWCGAQFPHQDSKKVE